MMVQHPSASWQDGPSLVAGPSGSDNGLIMVIMMVGYHGINGIDDGMMV